MKTNKAANSSSNESPERIGVASGKISHQQNPTTRVEAREKEKGKVGAGVPAVLPSPRELPTVPNSGPTANSATARTAAITRQISFCHRFAEHFAFELALIYWTAKLPCHDSGHRSLTATPRIHQRPRPSVCLQLCQSSCSISMRRNREDLHWNRVPTRGHQFC